MKTSAKPEFNGELTDWFGGGVLPEVPGTYQARTGGGHIFDRKFDGRFWRNAITGEVTTAQLDWRGIKPGSIGTMAYSPEIRRHLFAKDSTTHAQIGEQIKHVNQVGGIGPDEFAFCA